MRLTIPLALLALALPYPAVGEDLFSEIAVESVFSGDEAQSTGATAENGKTTPRITGAGQLGAVLRDAGYEPERLDAKRVKVTVAHGQWTIPTTLRAAVDRGQIDITMGLATPDKDAKWSADKLLDLLEPAPDAGGAHFAYQKSERQVQLRQTISARNLGGAQLGRLLTEMAELAASREGSWYQAEAKEQAAAPSPLTGAYVASLAAGEAFALNLTADGKFALAHVKSGKTTTSKGTVERTGPTLKLVGEGGVTITGTVSGQTDQGFDLTLPGGKKLVFKESVK